MADRLNLDILDQMVRELRRVLPHGTDRFRILVTKEGWQRLSSEVPMVPDQRGSLGSGHPAEPLAVGMFRGIPVYEVEPWSAVEWMKVQKMSPGVPRSFGLDFGAADA
jgi:hypothetical protein